MTASVLERFYMIDEGFFTFNLKYLFFVGLWPERYLTKYQKIAYKTYEIFIHILTIISIVITVTGTYHHKDDITVFLSNIDKTMAMYNFFLKTIIFCSKRDQLRDLIDAIERSGDKPTDERKKLIAKYIIFFTVYTAAIVGVFGLLALFEGKMVVEAWMPFDPTANLMSLITSSLIVVILISPGIGRNFATQGLVCSMIIYFCDQLILLHNELRSLEYSKEFDELTRIQFKKIIEKHIRLMGYSNSLEMIFSNYFLLLNLEVTLELCLNAVMMTLVGFQQMSLLISFMAYLLISLVYTYIYCYLGNELIIQSQGIALAAYESNWTSWPLDLQKKLLIMMIASQRPSKLTAGGMAWVSIQTFSQALQNGYTVFTLLNDVVN